MNSELRHQDTSLNITEVANKYNYHIDEHDVITEDGYILRVQRLRTRFTNRTEKGISVLLMHGVLDSADSWLLQGSKSLGFILANFGFDVWLGNARGNKYSASHRNLTVNDERFWNFTWEEIGIYDLPAMIDYIKNNKSSNLYYVGHSQGTTSFYAMASLRPEYGRKIKMMFSLAPVAWISNTKSILLRYISKIVNTTFFPVNVYTSSTEIVSKVSKLFCNMLIINCNINIIQPFIGYDHKLIEETMLPVIFEHFPTRSSTLQLIHYAQLINSRRFCRFDYGANNYLKYGQKSAPDYDLSKITTPMVLFYSDNDWLSDPLDVAKLSDGLPKVYKRYHLDKFNHFDYMYASVAKDAVYMKIARDIMSFEL
ncbi:unnamed protein product [Leptidea sinapis]|uniref:Lipase n=1 Tax=Leptidea sinapis TaxID=189913 RepID=A0A5E4QP41_9NEOP|nr:unnamed protein product [Leptidea sinapis]